MRSIFLALVCVGLLFPWESFGSVGVGVGLGKIDIEEPLYLGQIHDLPSLPILNTGTETSSYTVRVEYAAGDDFLRPERDWFEFTPETFELEPGGVQMVKIRLSLPVGKAEPGKYFAFLQGKPVYKDDTGAGVHVGVAAATKLTFDVVPSSFFQALRYRIRDLAQLWMPWTYIVPGMLALAVVLLLFRKFFALNLALGRRNAQSSPTPPVPDEEEILRLAEELKKKRANKAVPAQSKRTKKPAATRQPTRSKSTPRRQTRTGLGTKKTSAKRTSNG